MKYISTKRIFEVIIFFSFLLGFIYGYVFRTEFGLSLRMKHVQQKCATVSGVEASACFRDEYRHIVGSSNLNLIMQELEEKNYTLIRSSDTQSGYDCHALSHLVGEVIGSSEKANPSQLISSCGARCGYGCTHGVLMGALKRNYDGLNNLENFCKETNKNSRNLTDKIACYHGLGHGLAEYARYSVRDAMDYCNRLGTVDAQQECWTGVFMEVYSPVDFGHDPMPIPEDLFIHCGGLEDIPRAFCMRMMITTQYRWTHNIMAAFDLCRTYLSDDQDKCISTIGSDVYFVEHENITAIIHECLLAGPFVKKCIEGAVLSSLSIHGDGVQAVQLCKKTGQDIEPSCMKYALARLREIKGVK